MEIAMWLTKIIYANFLFFTLGMILIMLNRLTRRIVLPSNRVTGMTIFMMSFFVMLFLREDNIVFNGIYNWAYSKLRLMPNIGLLMNIYVFIAIGIILLPWYVNYMLYRERETIESVDLENLLQTKIKYYNKIYDIQREIKVYFHQGIKVPTNLGIKYGTILLPIGHYDEVSCDYIIWRQMSTMNKKNLFNQLLWLIFLGINWLNPMVWLLYLQWRKATEEAKDQQPLRYMGCKEKASYFKVLKERYLIKGKIVEGEHAFVSIIGSIGFIIILCFMTVFDGPTIDYVLNRPLSFEVNQLGEDESINIGDYISLTLTEVEYKSGVLDLNFDVTADGLEAVLKDIIKEPFNVKNVQFEYDASFPASKIPKVRNYHYYFSTRRVIRDMKVDMPIYIRKAFNREYDEDLFGPCYIEIKDIIYRDQSMGEKFESIRLSENEQEGVITLENGISIGYKFFKSEDGVDRLKMILDQKDLYAVKPYMILVDGGHSYISSERVDTKNKKQEITFRFNLNEDENNWPLRMNIGVEEIRIFPWQYKNIKYPLNLTGGAEND